MMRIPSQDAWNGNGRTVITTNRKQDFYADTRKAARIGICDEQPAPLKAIISRPMTAALSPHNEAGFDYHARPITDRPPSLKPLEFGEPSLLGRIYPPGIYTSSSNVTKRISIGTPTNFRRLDYTEQQRRSLIPLQLEPVTLRESVVVVPESGLGKDLPLTKTEYLDRHSRRQSLKERQSWRPMLSSHSSSSSMRSLRRQALETRSSSSSTSQSIDWSRLNRKRNTIRKSLSENTESDVEQEILELNTIVEEIRSESSRSQSSDGHVSAVAPLMSIRARSETLNDIGSVFSRPKQYLGEDESASEVNSDYGTQRLRPMENRLSRPFTATPEPSAVFMNLERKQSRSDSRIGEC